MSLSERMRCERETKIIIMDIDEGWGSKAGLSLYRGVAPFLVIHDIPQT